jgi:hypothetical protein
MSEERRLETAGIYSELWDGKPVKRLRALDGATVLCGRRLSMHLLVQPDAATQFLANPTLRDQGFLSRLLVAAPESIVGTRFYRDVMPEDDEAIRRYGARLLEILEARWPVAENKANELEPRTLTMSDRAVAAWRAFYDHVEEQCGPDQGLAPIRDFAAKAAEHAARIAGVLTIVADHGASEIDMDAMWPALALADWYVNEAARLQSAARTDAKLLRAQRLLEWMRERGGSVIGFREIVQFGPMATRTKAVADEAVLILVSHGWLVQTSSRPREFHLVSEGGGT